MTIAKFADWTHFTAALFAILAAPLADAALPFVQTQVETSAQARADVNGPSVTDTHAEGSDTAALLVSSSFAQMVPSTASADAIASLGFLRAQAFGTFPSFVEGSASAMARGFWSDNFVVDIPGHTGELAQLTASALVDGFADVVGDGRARIAIAASRDQSIAGGMTEVFLESGPQLGQLGPTFQISFFFTVGTPFQFAMSMQLDVDRAGTGPGAADINFFNTVVWNGISSVTLGGVSVSDFGFSSLSGLDYRESFAEVPPSPVPEPSSGFLVLAGLALLWLCAQQRTQSQA